MPFKLQEEIAIADACYELTGSSLNELFESGFYALMETMVEIETINTDLQRKIEMKNKDIEKLLFDFLEEVIYQKDADMIMYRNCKVSIAEKNSEYILIADLTGQEINDNVSTITDVKAITYYKFFIKKIESGWLAQVTFDI